MALIAAAAGEEQPSGGAEGSAEPRAASSGVGSRSTDPGPRAGGDAQDAAGSSADATSGAPAANSAEGLQESTAESVGDDIDDVPTRAPVDVFAGLKLTITVRIR